MEIIQKSISELNPYKNNPRKNDEAVEAVAESIRQFGFKVPVVIDNNGVIITGHTRVKAAKKLGIKVVPCIIADDLTPEQVKAFRLADNKVAEFSRWDNDLLNIELDGILDIDMSDFGFDLLDDEVQIEPENQRQRTNNSYNLDEYDPERVFGKYQMPIITGVDYIPKSLVGFNYARSHKDKDVGIHFFIDDYQFERVWDRPAENLDVLAKYNCMLTPDFSLYLNMPIAMKIWNVYRSRLIGQMAQNRGMLVIPTAQWAESDTFEFCFDGLPKRGTIAVSTIGVKNNKDALTIWQDGAIEMIKRLNPKRILLYGGRIDFDFGKIQVIEYNNLVTERMKEL